MGQVFISYARQDDEPFAKQLYQDLTAKGFDVWWDRETMESRGRTFLQEIRDAIAKSERVILVIGPMAVKSAYVRSEWEHAILFSKTVVPILRLGTYEIIPDELTKYALIPPELNLLHCQDFRKEQSYKDALKKLVDILKTPIPNLGKFLTRIPSIPTHFAPRLEQVNHIAEKVLTDVRKPTPTIASKRTTAIWGMGGSGKSVIAAAFARATETRRVFADGIIWLDWGEKKVDDAAVLDNINLLSASLNHEHKDFIDIRKAQAGLGKVLREKNCLIILDNVWQINQVQAFVDATGPRSRILITTRDGSLVTNLGAQEHRLGMLNAEEALGLLADWAEQNVTDLPRSAVDVTKECGYLPFAIALCGAMIRDGSPWNDLLEALREADLDFIERKLPNYADFTNVFKCLKVSMDSIAKTNPNWAKHYQELAVFTFDTAVPESVILTLWMYTGNKKGRDVRKILTTLERRAMLRMEGEAPNRFISLHDLQYDYLRATQTDPLKVLNLNIVEAYRQKCKDGWSNGPNDGYFFKKIVYHMIEAELKDELKAILLDLEWVTAKLQATDVFSLMADYDTFIKRWSNEKSIEEFRRFIKDQEYILQLNPELTFQQAINQPDTTASFRAAQSMLELNKISSPWFKWINKPKSYPNIQTVKKYNYGLFPWVFSPDGKKIVSALVGDGTLKIWDPQTGQKLATLKGHIATVNSCEWSPDGKRIISASEDCTMIVWNAEKGVQIKQLYHSKPVTCCAWSPDGERIISASESGNFYVWDGETFDRLFTLIGHYYSANCCAWSPDGKLVLSGSGDKTLKIWDPQTGQKLATLKGHSSAVGACAWSPDGKRIISGSHDGTSKIWDLQTIEKPVTLKMQKYYGVNYCAWSPDGKLVLSGSDDGTLKVWSAKTYKELKTLKGRDVNMSSCVWSPNNNHILSESKRGELLLWDGETGELIFSYYFDPWSVTTYAWSPDGERIIVATENGDLHILDGETGEELEPMNGRHLRVSHCAWSPDGRLVLSASDDGTLKIWDPQTGKKIATPKGHSAAVTCCAWSPDGKLVLSGSGDKTLKIWDPQTGQKLATLTGHKTKVKRSVWSPDSKRILSISENNQTLKIWDAENYKEFKTLKGHTDSVNCCAWSPNNDYALSASDDGTLKIWDPQTGEEIKTFKGHRGKVTSCVWLPDSERILSGSGDGTLKIWDKQTGAVLVTTKGNGDVINYCAVSHDGEFVLKVSENNPITVWSTETGAIICSLLHFQGSLITSGWSPDSKYILRISDNKILRMWDAKTESDLAKFTDQSVQYLTSILSRNGGQLVVVGDEGGMIYVLQLIGVDFETPIVTPVHLYRFSTKTFDTQATVKCYWCGQRLAVVYEMLGTEIKCKYCQKKLQLNPFYAENIK